MSLDTQKIFRNLMLALSYPGRVVNVASDTMYPGILYPETMDQILTLLDAEVTFHLVGEDEETEQEIKIRSLSKSAPLEKADYIVIPYSEREKTAEILRKVKYGSLLDPDQSATVFIESAKVAQPNVLTWMGPGIKENIQVGISDQELWLQARNEVVAEFPFGIDLFFVGKDKGLVGLPRTTEVKGAY